MKKIQHTGHGVLIPPNGTTERASGILLGDLKRFAALCSIFSFFSRWVLVLTSVVFSLWLTQSAGLAKKAVPRAPRALGPHISYILRQSAAQRGFWGVEVVRLRDGRVLFKQNENHLFMPASNMKLFTTAAALEKMGPEFIFRTTVETDAAPDARGRVNDLVLVGRGDANIGSRVVPYNLKTERKSPADQVFRELADQVAARGVREVRGNLVADDSYFLFEPFGHDWAEEDLQWGYAAPVTALAFNDNALSLHVQPATTVGVRALVSLDPINDYYRLNNRLETSAATGTKRVYGERAPGSMEMDVWGEVPVGSIVNDDTVSIENPPQLIGDLFLKLIEARGIKVRGRVVVRHLSRMDAAESSNPIPAPLRERCWPSTTRSRSVKILR